MLTILQAASRQTGHSTRPVAMSSGIGCRTASLAICSEAAAANSVVKEQHQQYAKLSGHP